MRNPFKVRVYDEFDKKIDTITDSDITRLKKKVNSLFGKLG